MPPRALNMTNNVPDSWQCRAHSISKAMVRAWCSRRTCKPVIGNIDHIRSICPARSCLTISLDSDRTALGVWRTTSNPNGLKWCAMLCLNSITTTLRILRSPCPCKAAVGNVGSPAPSQSVGEGVASWAGDSPLTLSVGGGGAPRGLGLGQPRGLGLGPPRGLGLAMPRQRCQEFLKAKALLEKVATTTSEAE